jgi:tetratricopeptide (TPR) repeat protein
MAVLLMAAAVRVDAATERSESSFRQLQLGYMALDSGDFEAALDHYARARDLARGDMERFQALFGFGSAALELDRNAEAWDALDEAHRIRPAETEATMLLGVACRRVGELDDAVRYLAQAAAGNPELTRALIELGITYGALERHTDQEKVYRRALEVDPTDPEARLGLAVALFHQDRYEDSVEAFRETIEVAPENLRAHYGLGLALFYSGDRNGAVEQVVYLKSRSPELASELRDWIFADQ